MLVCVSRNFTYALHLESLNMMLVLLSIQMFQPQPATQFSVYRYLMHSKWSVACVHAQACACMHACACAHIHTHGHTHTHTRTQASTHTHTHTPQHTHTRKLRAIELKRKFVSRNRTDRLPDEGCPTNRNRE